MTCGSRERQRGEGLHVSSKEPGLGSRQLCSHLDHSQRLADVELAALIGNPVGVPDDVLKAALLGLEQRSKLRCRFQSLGWGAAASLDNQICYLLSCTEHNTDML